MATWNRGWRTTLLDRRPSLATTCAGMSRHQMIESVGGMSGGSYGCSDGCIEIAETCLTPFEREAEPVGRRLRALGQPGIVGLGEVDDAPVVLEVHRQQLRVTVEAEARPDDRVELAGEEVGQVEGPDLLLLDRLVRGRACVELEAMRAIDPRDPLALQIGIERSARPAIGIRDEDPDVGSVPLSDLVDLGRDGVGDQLRPHME